MSSRDSHSRARSRDRSGSRSRSRSRSRDRRDRERVHRDRRHRTRSRSPERKRRSRSKSRSRSRSRSRDRIRRERERERDREQERQLSRADRQSVPFGERSAQYVEERLKKEAQAAGASSAGPAAVVLTPDMDEAAMMAALGLPSNFDTTQGKEVPDGNVAGVRVQSKRQYRQYMNRKGGFNRPLAPSY